ncbi:endonuclease III domain-containing protein [Salinithrix halophila]|uniref:Endonuclease III domain-containing protein n=1 Tax=Salinithrix halophila TaxID=1485204 RepID=A0ABV8JFJ8_9BACL
MEWKALYEGLRKWKPGWTVEAWWGLLHPFEKGLGSILVQNTAWTNAVRAIDSLRLMGLTCPRVVLDAPVETLQEGVRPAGFPRAKAEAIRGLSHWFLDHGGIDGAFAGDGDLLRWELLSIRGIGPETADMVLLYVLEKPTFIGDAYTRRIISRWQGVSEPRYEEIRTQVMRTLSQVADQQLFHALLVELGKEHCHKRRPRCTGCPLQHSCKFSEDRYSKGG